MASVGAVKTPGQRLADIRVSELGWLLLEFTGRLPQPVAKMQARDTENRHPSQSPARHRGHRLQRPARHRGHRNRDRDGRRAEYSARCKGQPDTEGIETRDYERRRGTRFRFRAVAKASPTPRA